MYKDKEKNKEYYKKYFQEHRWEYALRKQKIYWKNKAIEKGYTENFIENLSIIELKKLE